MTFSASTHPKARDEESAQQLAERAVSALRGADHTARALSIDLDEVAPGRAVVSMTVTQAMINGHGVLHGGFLFLLADTAFAYASSTHGGTVVSRHGEIAFVAPGRLGDRLIAFAQERITYGRSGIYDVSIDVCDGPRLAEFRGQSQHLRGPLEISR